MMRDRERMRIERPWLWLGLVALMAAIFAADTLTNLEIAVAVLYVAVILISVRFDRPVVVVSFGLGSAVLTVLSYLLTQRGAQESGLVNGALSLIAIAATTYLALRIEAAEARVRQAQAELAHMSRVTTMGELTASIAHEVSQPLAGIVASGHAALRWLAATPSDVGEARRALERVVADADRAGEVVGRVRNLVAKSPPSRDRLDMVALIEEVLTLTRSELRRHRLVLRTDLADDLAQPLGDRVQLQQVVLNLVINAAEAMGGLESGPRDLLVGAASDGGRITVSVRDTGVSLTPAAIEQVFEAFHSTKPGGMGMGLAISRSIVEAHGGTIYAAVNHPRGMVFGFTLPVAGATSERQHG
ncbi:serine/threonine protein kinase [Bosea sp. Root483D1]|uniref:sensor histidine kinase n=1 Tax=Bosea sp. Root483D1 TaxID=1736544 RepID=UPI000709921A|nr:ATP-binding protein [Bosea sp. Root483D1]KRE14601.1 serine/threonine protein kinase [Bosea sp. Root483D1]